MSSVNGNDDSRGPRLSRLEKILFLNSASLETEAALDTAQSAFETGLIEWFLDPEHKSINPEYFDDSQDLYARAEALVNESFAEHTELDVCAIIPLTDNVLGDGVTEVYEQLRKQNIPVIVVGDAKSIVDKKYRKEMHRQIQDNLRETSRGQKHFYMSPDYKSVGQAIRDSGIFRSNVDILGIANPEISAEQSSDYMRGGAVFASEPVDLAARSAARRDTVDSIPMDDAPMDFELPEHTPMEEAVSDLTGDDIPLMGAEDITDIPDLPEDAVIAQEFDIGEDITDAVVGEGIPEDDSGMVPLPASRDPFSRYPTTKMDLLSIEQKNALLCGFATDDPDHPLRAQLDTLLIGFDVYVNTEDIGTAVRTPGFSAWLNNHAAEIGGFDRIVLGTQVVGEDGVGEIKNFYEVITALHNTRNVGADPTWAVYDITQHLEYMDELLEADSDGKIKSFNTLQELVTCLGEDANERLNVAQENNKMVYPGDIHKFEIPPEFLQSADDVVRADNAGVTAEVSGGDDYLDALVGESEKAVHVASTHGIMLDAQGVAAIHEVQTNKYDVLPGTGEEVSVESRILTEKRVLPTLAEEVSAESRIPTENKVSPHIEEVVSTDPAHPDYDAELQKLESEVDSGNALALPQDVQYIPTLEEVVEMDLPRKLTSIQKSNYVKLLSRCDTREQAEIRKSIAIAVQNLDGDDEMNNYFGLVGVVAEERTGRGTLEAASKLLTVNISLFLAQEKPLSEEMRALAKVCVRMYAQGGDKLLLDSPDFIAKHGEYKPFVARILTGLAALTPEHAPIITSTITALAYDMESRTHIRSYLRSVADKCDAEGAWNKIGAISQRLLESYTRALKEDSISDQNAYEGEHTSSVAEVQKAAENTPDPHSTGPWVAESHIDAGVLSPEKEGGDSEEEIELDFDDLVIEPDAITMPEPESGTMLEVIAEPVQQSVQDNDNHEENYDNDSTVGGQKMSEGNDTGVRNSIEQDIEAAQREVESNTPLTPVEIPGEPVNRPAVAAPAPAKVHAPPRAGVSRGRVALYVTAAAVLGAAGVGVGGYFAADRWVRPMLQEKADVVADGVLANYTIPSELKDQLKKEYAQVAYIEVGERDGFYVNFNYQGDLAGLEKHAEAAQAYCKIYGAELCKKNAGTMTVSQLEGKIIAAEELLAVQQNSPLMQDIAELKSQHNGLGGAIFPPLQSMPAQDQKARAKKGYRGVSPRTQNPNAVPATSLGYNSGHRGWE
ncbi:MAG: hypothetical protein V1729_03225 [Candidatus Woesearchaeota archaeon]